MKYIFLVVVLLLLPVLFRMRRQGKTVGGWKTWVAVGGIALLWIVAMQFAVRLGGKFFILLLLLTVFVFLFFRFFNKR